LELGQIVDGNVRLVGMMLPVVLVMSLGRIKRAQRHHLRHDRLSEDFGAVELVDIGLGDAALVVVGVKNRGAILPAFVPPLPVQLRWIMRALEKYFQVLDQGYLGRIEKDANRCSERVRDSGE